MAYQIYRHFLHGKRRKVRRVSTLALAQEHCQNPETSSRTCKGSTGKRRTRLRGPWFDSYEEVR